MNNFLAQKAQYYLNESEKLSEELKLEREYRELLENILIGALTEEQVCQIKEGLMKKLGAAALAGSCLLGTACGKAPEAPKPTPVHAGVQGQDDLLQQKPKAAPKAAQKAAQKTPSKKIPGAGAEGEI